MSTQLRVLVFPILLSHFPHLAHGLWFPAPNLMGKGRDPKDSSGLWLPWDAGLPPVPEKIPRYLPEVQGYGVRCP